MPVVSSYLEQLARVQFYRSERGVYFSDQTAFYIAGRFTTMLPILHAVVAIALLQSIAYVFGVPDAVGWGARFACLVPFLGAMIWLASNTSYLQLLRQKVRGESSETDARRRGEAKYFTRASYVSGIVSFVLLAIEQTTKHGT